MRSRHLVALTLLIACEPTEPAQQECQSETCEGVPAPEVADAAAPAPGGIDATAEDGEAADDGVPEDVSPVEVSLAEVTPADPEVVADSEVPVAVGAVEEGAQVRPQTVIHLDGGLSAAPGGVAEFEWDVTQPPGSASVFIPSRNVSNPSFEANVAGLYEFRLHVYDANGNQSLTPWTYQITVVPDEALHVELLWHTPNDSDETDEGPEAGSDMDLHFAHAEYATSNGDYDGDGAPDPWFDQPFDTFWFNAHPNWGSFNPSVDDDPGLDRDDTDGAGPENLNLNLPEKTVYSIGVHYWSDHAYGDSYATVRVYLYGQLAWESSEVLLHNYDLWHVADVDWTTGVPAVIPIQTPAGDPQVTPGYYNPYFVP